METIGAHSQIRTPNVRIGRGVVEIFGGVIWALATSGVGINPGLHQVFHLFRGALQGIEKLGKSAIEKLHGSEMKINLRRQIGATFGKSMGLV